MKKIFASCIITLLFIVTFSMGNLKVTNATTTAALDKLVGYYTGTYEYAGCPYNIILDIKRDNVTCEYLATMITLKAPYDIKCDPVTFLKQNAIGYYELKASYNLNTNQYVLQGNRIDKTSPSICVTLAGCLEEKCINDAIQVNFNGTIIADGKTIGNFCLTKSEAFTLIGYPYCGGYYGYPEIFKMEFERIKKLNA